MNDSSLVVKSTISVEAPLSKVWEVLVAPKYIRQWDNLPQDFDDFYLEEGRVIEWTGMSKLTVTNAEPYELLRLSFYEQKWEKPAAAYDIAYTYRLSQEDKGTLLSLEIGDFGVLVNGQEYFDASVEIAEKSLTKIKSLAENRV
ncbi:SRPBCC family protein [Dyadobacter sandarakinus]|uniref:SRPBCC domain-containing protein n=1 Tax=Dyadobacter sandarakinus TaxID=2747268 RepID=A0ABX7I4Z8_9BACT|nr:SRPBCC domain-containing protein [Dyadobacter sandarakinus]QRR01010.1 SRPBCC domain-containing protein [Dyadobacter sandarakinus]